MQGTLHEYNICDCTCICCILVAPSYHLKWITVVASDGISYSRLSTFCEGLVMPSCE